MPKAYTAVDWSMCCFEVHFKMKLTYRTPVNDDEDELVEPDADMTWSGKNLSGETCGKMQWDDCCPWSKWYSAEDPVKGFELLAIWLDIKAETSLDMAELENASPLEAEKWFFRPRVSQNLGSLDRSTVGFASQLRLLVKALEMSMEANFLEDFVSVKSSGSENLESSSVVPPPTVLDCILKELFLEAEKEQLDSSLSEHKNSQLVKGAPLGSLFAQFCLHTLWFGNCSIQAIIVLWIEFVREVQRCWEESQPLPRMPTNGKIDLSTCLINQKLHMLSICIEKKRQEVKGQNGTDDWAPTPIWDEIHTSRDVTTSQEINDSAGRKYDRSGSSNIAGSMMLLRSCKIMQAPITQDLLPMTEDMHEERLTAAEALGGSGFSAQLENDILSSDMSAFKAANPDAVFEDFIRWHSPKDWEDDEINAMKVPEVKLPPVGRLSERMSACGNSWRKLWNEALPLPASKQKPLLDPDREAEKVLHYLETLKPCQLLEQMICTAFKAAADTLNQTSIGELEQMSGKMGELYVTVAYMLKYLQAHGNARDDVVEDLRRLCGVFEHVEKLLLLVVSVCSKLQSPYLAQAIFNGHFDSHLPNMGAGAALSDTRKEFEKWQQVRSCDRNSIAAMFSAPTANQTWRKVLSMGNLLNGHEPISREIIFSKHTALSGSYCVTPTEGFEKQQDVETCRMYVCGTSNDVRVALAVTSSD